MRPFFGTLLLFFILFFSETEASGSWTPKIFKKKGESSKKAKRVGDVNLNAIPPPPKYTVPDINESVDEQAKGKAKKKVINLNRKPRPGNHDTPELQEAHNIHHGPWNPNSPFPEPLQLLDNQRADYEKDMKEYHHYQKFEAAFGQYATPAYLPNPNTNYGDYNSGGAANLGSFEHLVSQPQQALQNQEQIAFQMQQQHALQTQQQHDFQIQQQHALQNQEQIAFQMQQQHALQTQQQHDFQIQQQHALQIQQQHALQIQQQHALQNQQQHDFYNNMGYNNNPSGGDPNTHFHGGPSEGDPNTHFHGGHSGGHGSGYRD